MKKRKSLAATYIKIIIALLIIACGIYFGFRFLNKEYNIEEFETVKTNLLLIQGKTEIIAQKVEIKEEGAKYIGTPIKEKQEEAQIKNLIESNVINIDSEDSNYYYIDNGNLGELGLENMNIDGSFVVDYKQNDVIYVNGIKNESGHTVYKLSEMS